MIVSFEGIDFCGKSTHIALLAKKLMEKDYSVMICREPGGVAISERIRDVLLDCKNVEMDKITELLLFFASRNQFVTEVLARNYKTVDFILVDRFYDSSYIYQGFGRGIPLYVISYLIDLTVPEHLRPTKTFFLDIPYEVSLERKGKRADDRIEKAGPSFYKHIIEGYKALSTNSERVVRINSDREVEEIHLEILDHFTRFLT